MNNTLQHSDELQIRNQGIAAFVAYYLQQHPTITLDKKKRVVFAFKTSLCFAQIRLLYLNSETHQTHEIGILLRKEKHRLLN